LNITAWFLDGWGRGPSHNTAIIPISETTLAFLVILLDMVPSMVYNKGPRTERTKNEFGRNDVGRTKG